MKNITHAAYTYPFGVQVPPTPLPSDVLENWPLLVQIYPQVRGVNSKFSPKLGGKLKNFSENFSGGGGGEGGTSKILAG